MTPAIHASDLYHELDAARRSCRRCPRCGEAPTINYEPGVMCTECKCGTLVVLPEWNPKEIAKRWNARK